MDRLAVYTGTRNIYQEMLVSAKSLLANNGADHVFLLIEDDTFPEKLPDCITTMNISNQTFFRPDGPNYKSRWTYMVLIRAALSKLFPDADRILHLDHDTIVRKPIDYIWNLNLSDYYYAAVEEKQIRGREHPYFNFGVVLHNLAKLRTDGMDDTIIDTLNTKHFAYCEQDAVNDLCYNRILEIPPEYNALNFNLPRVPEENVIIRHYATRNRNMNIYADYILYNNMPWTEVLAHSGKAYTAPLTTRHDVINAFILSRDYHSFLEIGTDTGISLRTVHADTIVSVDPDARTPATHHMTSDDYFFTHNDKFDIIFIDGLHEHNQAYRDINNALQHLNRKGVIVLHDCLPTSERMQRHSDHYPGGEWTGDVWKAFVRARSELPYEMYTIDTDYGCGIIDTSIRKPKITYLPSDMESMTYNQFVQNRNDWMNVKGGIIHA